jgi:hypothetical protein
VVKFKIGQKVVAVGFNENHKEFARRFGCAIPVNGNVYTIRDRAYLPRDIGDSHHNGNGYRLEEIVNPPRAYCITLDKIDEVWFDEEFFRPLVDTKATMENLMRLSDPKKWTREDVKRLQTAPARKKESAA